MDAEMEALHRNGTWRLVPPRSGLNVIDSRWVQTETQRRWLY
jgi:hypothetical protein